MFHIHQSLLQYQCTGRISDFYVTLFRDERKSFSWCHTPLNRNRNSITHHICIVFCEESVISIQNIRKIFLHPRFPIWKFRTKRWGWANFLKIHRWGRNIHLRFVNQRYFCIGAEIRFFSSDMVLIRRRKILLEFC